MTKVCIIGAGCSGITTAKRLREYGVAYDQFELSDDVGGNWYFENPNGRSACYESLHIDTSKTRLQFEDFPVPEEWPDFPQPPADARLLPGLRRGVRAARRDRVRDRRGARRTPRRRRVGRDAVDRRDPQLHRPRRRQRPPLVAPAPRLPGHVRRRADAQPRLRLAVRAARDPRQARDRGRHGQLGDGHRQRAVLAAGWPTRSTSRHAGVCGCCRSTATASRPTR